MLDHLCYILAAVFALGDLILYLRLRRSRRNHAMTERALRYWRDDIRAAARQVKSQTKPQAKPPLPGVRR
jgi:hypothetical protein